MPYTALKILSYALAWTMPAALLYHASRRVPQSSVNPSAQKVLPGFLIPVAWLLGLGFVTLGQYCNESAWHDDHSWGAQTEEDMVAPGDYPNVFAMWVLAGWIPVVIGLVLARRASRNKQDA